MEENIIARAEALRREVEAVCREAGRDPASVTLLAATKVQSAERVRAVLPFVDACGENRVQEFCEKYDAGAYTGKPVHFIGHLQTNKVKFLVGRCDLIQSVDSPRLAKAISDRAVSCGTVQDILAELNIGRDENKTGCLPEELPELLSAIRELPGVHLRGLMCVPPKGTPEETAPWFAKTREIYETYAPEWGFDILSMGMSGDWAAAVREGSTLIRVGTGIFGARI